MSALPQPPAWVDSLFRSAQLDQPQGFDTALDKAEVLANQLAPNTRRLWSWALTFQGFAVIAPLLWIVTNQAIWHLSYTAYVVIVSAVLMVCISWWIRWRGMQKTWARSRLVAEIARSLAATHLIDAHATLSALKITPELHAIARMLINLNDDLNSNGHHKEAFNNQHKNQYLEGRVDDQIKYYQSKQQQALTERKQLSRIVTLSLDIALFLAFAGLIIAIHPNAKQWLNWSGSHYLLGVMGSALPLIALLAQLKGTNLELNRRVGRYAQQILYLQTAKDQLTNANNPESTTEIIVHTEATLLGEVIEWYYQTENNEPYYRYISVEPKVSDNASYQHSSKSFWLMSHLSGAASFIGRVVFGRVIVVVLSAIFTTLLIQYNRVPDDPAIQSSLRLADGELLAITPAGNYDFWQPKPIRQSQGIVIIAHGLGDGIDKTATKNHWMTQMEKAIKQRFGHELPEIILVNWKDAARPSTNSALKNNDIPLQLIGLPNSVKSMLRDLVSIRPQGERIGELLGFKLASLFKHNKLDIKQPIHFIGHSAGGFVAMRAALTLNDLGFIPKDIRITLLDTPLPDKADLERLITHYPVDFYASSIFAQGIPDNRSSPNITLIKLISTEEERSPITDHSYSHQWYMQSVINEKGNTGFNLSPLVKKK